MKRLFCCIGLILIIAACSKVEEGNENSTQKPETPKAEIKIDDTSADFTSEGGSEVIAFSSSGAWTAEVINSRADSWCSVNPTSGAAGDAKVTVTTKANDTPDDRTASIIIKTGTASRAINVSQKQKDALTVTASKFEVGSEGGEVTIEVKANIDFEYEIEGSAQEWISYQTTRALKTSSLVFNVTANESTEKREGKIVIRSGELNEVINVYQSAKPTIVISQNEYILSHVGETITVEVASNVDVSVEMPSGVDWISEDITRSLSTNTYRFNVLPNNYNGQREADIKFTNKANGLCETVKVVQMHENAIVFAKSQYDISSDVKELGFEILTDAVLEVTADVDWIKQAAPEKSPADILTFNFEENKLGPREGLISIAAGEHQQKIRIRQEGKNLPFVIKQKEYVLPLEGCAFVVEINYTQPYIIVNQDQFGIVEDHKISSADGCDKLLYIAKGVDNETIKELVVSDKIGLITDTIRVVQCKTDEYLHIGQGNSGNEFHHSIYPHSGGIASESIYTNLNDYDIIIYGNTETHQIKHLQREETGFGFNEFFEMPYNNTGKDLEFELIFIGKNITFVRYVTIRRQLFVNFEEDDTIYISQDGETFTTHAWTEDNNLNIRLEGDDTSWLIVKNTEDTYIDGIRRINTTFEALPNQSGKTREITIVAFNGFNDQDIVRVIQASGESLILSSDNMYVGAWEDSYELIIKNCDYTIDIDDQSPWLSIGDAIEKNGGIVIPLNVAAYSGTTEREARITIKSDNISNTVHVRQFPESGAMIDDSDPEWKAFLLPEVKFETPYPNSHGSKLYHAIVEDPKELIAIQSRRVLDLLYFSPDEPLIPRRDAITYRLDNFDGISYCSGTLIALNNKYIEDYYYNNGAKALVAENKGVLSHELTHLFQLEPQGVGGYDTNPIFHACIEGMADAVRVLSGGLTNPSDRPTGGSYMDSYRYTGFFIAWLVQNKDKDFLRKFNLSTQHVIPWSFDGAIKYALGDQYNVDALWEEYLRAMGDIK